MNSSWLFCSLPLWREIPNTCRALVQLLSTLHSQPRSRATLDQRDAFSEVWGLPLLHPCTSWAPKFPSGSERLSKALITWDIFGTSSFSMPGKAACTKNIPRINVFRHGSATHPGVQLWSVALVTGAPGHPGEASLKRPNKFPSSPILQFAGERGKKVQFQGLSLPLDIVCAPSFLWAVGAILTLGKKEMDVFLVML